MSENNNEPTIQELADPVVIGTNNYPLVLVSTPERTRRTSSGEKTVAAKVTIRVAPLQVAAALAFFTDLVNTAEKRNAGDGAKLAEKILGRHITSAYDDALVVSPTGDVNFVPAKYSEALTSVRRAKSSTSSEDLNAQHSLLLEQAVALSDIRESWRNDGKGLPEDPNTGEPIGHPWDAARWAAETDKLNSNERLQFNLRLDSFQALVTVILNGKDRRIALEKEIALREQRKREAAAKREATKKAKGATADQPAGQA